MGQPEELREVAAVAPTVLQGTLPAQGQTWALSVRPPLSWDIHAKAGVPMGKDGVCCHHRARVCRYLCHSSLWG